jgi:hypothetical protein
MAVDATNLRDAAALVETTMNALIAAKAAPNTVTLEAATTLAVDARTAIDALTSEHQALQNECLNQGGTSLG